MAAPTSPPSLPPRAGDYAGQQPVPPQQQQQHPLRVVFVIETTFAAAAIWASAREWCFENILRHVERIQKGQPQPQNVQIALVSFGTAGPSSPYAVEATGWTADVARVRRWLDRLRFTGGGTCNAALLEALAEAVYAARQPYPGGARPPSSPGGAGAPPVAHTHCVLLSVSPHGRQFVRWPFSEETGAARAASGFYRRLSSAMPPVHAKGVAEAAAGAGAGGPGAADLQDVAASLPDHGVTLSAVTSLRMAPVLQLKILLSLRHALPGPEPRVCSMPASSVLLLSPEFALGADALKPMLLQIKQLRAARHKQQQAGGGRQVSGGSSASAGSVPAGPLTVNSAGGVDTPASAAPTPQQQQQQQQIPVQQQQQQGAGGGWPAAGGSGGGGMNAQARAAVAAAAGAAARLAGMPDTPLQAPQHPQQQQQHQQHQHQQIVNAGWAQPPNMGQSMQQPQQLLQQQQQQQQQQPQQQQPQQQQWQQPQQQVWQPQQAQPQHHQQQQQQPLPPHQQAQLWAGTVLWSVQDGGAASAAWGVAPGTPLAEVVFWVSGQVPPHLDAARRRQNARGGAGHVLRVGGMSELKQAVGRWKEAGHSQDAVMFKVARPLAGWEAMKRRYDAPGSTRPDLCLVCSLGPELQAVMMLTRIRKPGQLPEPRPDGEPPSLLAAHHCFLSAPLAAQGQ